MFLTKWSLVYSGWRIVSYACHNLPEEESKVHGDEDQYHKVIQEANNSKYSLWYQVKGGEEIEQPHCSQEDHPELEGKVKALPTDQVVDKVAQQYRKVPDHFRERSWLARVTSVIGVHFSQKSIPGQSFSKKNKNNICFNIYLDSISAMSAVSHSSCEK